MKDNQSTAMRARSSSPSAFTSSERSEVRDDQGLDEPLASGQRKRYLASLGAGTIA